MTVKKLTVVEFEVKEDFTENYKAGEKYSYFIDPLTGKYYRPKDSFSVEGDNLEDLFVEVEKWNVTE